MSQQNLSATKSLLHWRTLSLCMRWNCNLVEFPALNIFPLVVFAPRVSRKSCLTVVDVVPEFLDVIVLPENKHVWMPRQLPLHVLLDVLRAQRKLHEVHIVGGCNGQYTLTSHTHPTDHWTQNAFCESHCLTAEHLDKLRVKAWRALQTQ